jgi:hypothetical protein
MKNNSKNVKKQRNTRRGQRGLTARDDIPLRPIHTYCTASTPIPAVTDFAVVRALGHGTVVAQATASTAAAFNFTLSQSGTSSGNFDQYKIMAIRFTIVPDQNAVGLFTNSTTAYTPLYCVIDYDDSTNLGSVANAEGYSNCIVLGAGESCERTFKPRCALSAYTGSFGGFANMSDQWIDAASTTVQHYGIKVFIPGATAAQTLLPSWQVSIEYFFAFRKSI